MRPQPYRSHEVQFCSEVSKWADRLFESRPDLPFGSSEIEGFSTGGRKRQDFRVYGRGSQNRSGLALCGEVKLPGSPQGRSPFDMALVQDAFDKATTENCRYFFTWNVEHLALFDRSLWDAQSMYERCIGEWKLGLELNSPSDLTRPEAIFAIRDQFLPRFFTDFGDIWLERKRDVRPLPADFYVTVLESYLAGPLGPVRELRDYLSRESERSKSFDARLRVWAIEQQWNFDRNDPRSWRGTVDRAARSMAYVLSNRILFYQAVRLRNDLPDLIFPRSIRTPRAALDYLRRSFQEAVDVTGDYEPVFFPDSPEEWAALAALSGTNSLDAWAKFSRAVDRFKLIDIPTDILGHTFQKLISPEERHKFGQHYTDENIVDVINAFCIYKADATVLDPACGSGTFLVRAYYRKSELDKRLRNQELLKGLYGCDINPFPAHLATLNLAARNISNEENYPRVVRRNFFTVTPNDGFCELPRTTRDRDGHRQRETIELPVLDAIVGNPPYVRYQEVPKRSDKGAITEQTREYLAGAAEKAAPGIKLSGQSDVHVYFWPVAAQFLANNGWFGFLTSSSWLDARYGFALQRWVLSNFCIVAIIESVNEPWFEDARVKTAVTILKRVRDEKTREENLIRFVRVLCPLVEILGKRENEAERQAAAEKFRDLILNTASDSSTDQLRIMVKRQGDLWHEGLSIGEMFAKQKDVDSAQIEIDDTGSPDEESVEVTTELGAEELDTHTGDYGGGKWGRYLRAPDFYFEIMREFGSRFTRIGEVASIKYGILSGCDGFFMPRNVSAEVLKDYPTEMAWNNLPLMQRCKRAEVAKGEILIVRCSDGTLHPIEPAFVRPELHSLMQVDRPVVGTAQLDRVVLWVDQDLENIKGTYACRYITWGSKQTFQSKKSQNVTIPKRPGCAGRNPWYNVTGRAPGIGFWPMAQQYRHIVPANPEHISCNHNLFDVHSLMADPLATRALVPILNSTVIALFKTFYGRYAGTEGNLKTEIVDAVLIEIPDPRNVTPPLLQRMESALASLQEREVTHLVEEAFLQHHTGAEVREAADLPLSLPKELNQADRRALDDAVFELLGVADAGKRAYLIDRLYKETASHFRSIRIVEVQKMEQRRHGGSKDEVSQIELASDAWSALESEWQVPLRKWLLRQIGAVRTVNLPDGEVRLPAASHFFEATTVYFGKDTHRNLVCSGRTEAELLTAIAKTGLRGDVLIPTTERGCRQLAERLQTRLVEAAAKFEVLAQERAGSENLRRQINFHLHHWFIHGFE